MVSLAGHAQRVVPRRNDGDHALGVAQLGGMGQQGERAPAALGAEVLGGVAGVVPRDDADVEDFQERVAAGLAVLGLHQVEGLVLAGQDEVVVAQQDPLALLDWRGGPGLLRGPGTGERVL